MDNLYNFGSMKKLLILLVLCGCAKKNPSVSSSSSTTTTTTTQTVQPCAMSGAKSHDIYIGTVVNSNTKVNWDARVCSQGQYDSSYATPNTQTVLFRRYKTDSISVLSNYSVQVTIDLVSHTVQPNVLTKYKCP